MGGSFFGAGVGGGGGWGSGGPPRPHPSCSPLAAFRLGASAPGWEPVAHPGVFPGGGGLGWRGAGPPRRVGDSTSDSLLAGWPGWPRCSLHKRTHDSSHEFVAHLCLKNRGSQHDPHGQHGWSERAPTRDSDLVFAGGEGPPPLPPPLHLPPWSVGGSRAGREDLGLPPCSGPPRAPKPWWIGRAPG